MPMQTLAQKIPAKFSAKVPTGWTNGAKDWHIKGATSGLYTLDIEHVSDDLVKKHNDLTNPDSIASLYRSLCLHNCPACFNEQSMVYSKEKRDLSGRSTGGHNQIMSLDQTMNVIDQAISIAQDEGHDFRSVKFLGPGELLLNKQLFTIIEEYYKRGVTLNIFTKGALLGSDKLSREYHGISALDLIDKLFSCENIGLLFSFQSCRT